MIQCMSSNETDNNLLQSKILTTCHVFFVHFDFFVVFYFYMNQKFTVVEMSDALNKILLCSNHKKFNRNMYYLITCVHWNHEFYKIKEQSNNMLKYFHYSGIRSRTSEISFQFSYSFSLYTYWNIKFYNILSNSLERIKVRAMMSKKAKHFSSFFFVKLMCMRRSFYW